MYVYVHDYLFKRFISYPMSTGKYQGKRDIYVSEQYLIQLTSWTLLNILVSLKFKWETQTGMSQTKWQKFLGVWLHGKTKQKARERDRKWEVGTRTAYFLSCYLLVVITWNLVRWLDIYMDDDGQTSALEYWSGPEALGCMWKRSPHASYTQSFN